jgi:acetate---CoA ligase (ADP-forming) subunit beta
MGSPREIIEKVKGEGRAVLTEMESKELLKGLGIPTTDMRLAVTEAEAVAMSAEIGYPCVLKVSSHDISHKSDAGGVKVGLKDGASVAAAYQAIMASCRAAYPGAVIEGVTVQTMAKPGVEVIVGMATDPQFGPVLMFGLGGVWVELLKDVSFKIVPLTRRDAAEAIGDIKAARLLEGFRGSDPVDKGALEDILLRVSEFVAKTPEVAEMDLNPIFAYADGAVAVDARVILGSVN